MKIRRSIPERRTIDNIVFDSIAEAEHYLELKTARKAGIITKLQMQPKFTFIVNGVQVGTYKPDFSFIEVASNQVCIHEVKGWKRSAKTGKMLPRVDRDFSLRKNLMLALFGLTVEIV